MEESSIWAVKPKNIRLAHGRPKSGVRNTWTGPIEPQLYSDSLNELDRQTQLNLTLLKRAQVELTTRPSLTSFQRKSSDELSSQFGSGVMFAPRATFMTSSRSALADDDDDSSSRTSAQAVTSFCYLCSTLDEHQRHLLHASKKPKILPKQRISYIAPPPKVRPKLIEEPGPVFDHRYKVVVWTGDKPGASTDARVYISIKGDKDVLYKTPLCHGGANKTFCFCRGYKDVFYVKSPRLGNLQALTVHLKSDGQKKHTWFCDKIKVVCLKTYHSWLFDCRSWLSLKAGEYKTFKNLVAVHEERKFQDFEVTVTTGSKKLAGTDANVSVTFYGTQGNSPKIRLVADAKKKAFQKDSVDKFHVKFPDIGEIKTLRIEHDGAGFAPGWFLENVVMRDVKDPSIVYYFLLHGWLASDIGDGRLWREIKAKKSLTKEIVSGKLAKYGVTVRTGDVRYAGTDANVYVIIQGRSGKTKKLFMDDNKNNFEKGMTEHFELEAFNTGPITSILIGHDNTGPGAGWYCEDVTVRKYLGTEDRVHFFNELKQKLKSQQRKRRPSRQEAASPTDETDDEVDVKRYRDALDTDGKIIKIPMYEEYYFECKAWLAKDEGDGLIERELDVKRRAIVFKDK